MSTYHDINLTDAPFIADTDLTAKQYFFVTAASTANYVKLATGASNPAVLGILQNSPSAGQEARVRLLGPSKVSAANAACNIRLGQFVIAGSGGQAEVDGNSTCSPTCGRWLSANVTSGSVFGEMMFYGLTACAVSAS